MITINIIQYGLLSLTLHSPCIPNPAFVLPPAPQLGEYNLRGVEAGMNMVAIGTKKSGKVLNTKNRRQKRGARSPYERRSIHDKEPGC